MVTTIQTEAYLSNKICKKFFLRLVVLEETQTLLLSISLWRGGFIFHKMFINYPDLKKIT